MSTRASYRLTGLTCDACVVAVTEEFHRLDGVQSVAVELHPDDVSVVTVISDAPLLGAAVRDAVDEAGYALAS